MRSARIVARNASGHKSAQVRCSQARTQVVGAFDEGVEQAGNFERRLQMEVSTTSELKVGEVYTLRLNSLGTDGYVWNCAIKGKVNIQPDEKLHS